MTSFLLPLFAVLGVGYLFGSIPFGLLLTRAAGLGDVRKIGSGNIGATNVLRTGNKGLAALTLLLDMLKGTAAVLFSGYVLLPYIVEAAPSIQRSIMFAQTLPWIAGLGAFLGHVFPVWLGFKGGKGVATYIGVLLVAPPGDLKAPAVFCVVWLLTAVVTRYSSLAALVATFVTFVYFAYVGGPFVTPVVAIMSSLLFWKHRENIRRLMAGQESRIGAKA